MNKSDFINSLAERRDLNLFQAEQIVGTVFDSMSESLISGDRIEIRGFGSFCLREYPGYTGRNPKTGEFVEIKPKKQPFFKVGKDLKERIMGSCPESKGEMNS